MNRTAHITVRLTQQEFERLSQQAREANLNRATYLHRLVTQKAAMRRDTAVLLGEIGRLSELVKRAFKQAGVPMEDISAGVSAIDARVFVAQVEGVLSGQ